MSRRGARHAARCLGVLAVHALACSDPGQGPAPPSAGVVSGVSASAPALVLDRPAAETWDGDRPAYASAAELCAYLNAARDRGREHPRFSGVPWQGSYHDVWTWPVVLADDAALSAGAQLEANRLAAGGAPPGSMHRDSAWRRPVWFDGIGSERQQMSARDQPGDWDPTRSVEGRAAIIETNGAVRLGLLHQDGGGAAPVLRRMGCGEALAADGRARWWVVLLAP